MGEWQVPRARVLHNFLTAVISMQSAVCESHRSLRAPLSNTTHVSPRRRVCAAASATQRCCSRSRSDVAASSNETLATHQMRQARTDCRGSRKHTSLWATVSPHIICARVTAVSPAAVAPISSKFTIDCLHIVDHVGNANNPAASSRPNHNGAPLSVESVVASRHVCPVEDVDVTAELHVRKGQRLLDVRHEGQRRLCLESHSSG